MGAQSAKKDVDRVEQAILLCKSILMVLRTLERPSTPRQNGRIQDSALSKNVLMTFKGGCLYTGGCGRIVLLEHRNSRWGNYLGNATSETTSVKFVVDMGIALSTKVSLAKDASRCVAHRVFT
eukprot:402585-Amphidinium_carterae.1